MKVLLTLTFLFFAIFIFPSSNVLAAKRKPAPQVVAVFYTPKNTVNVNYVNLAGVKKISYVLTYNSGSVPKGVMGSFPVNKKTIVKKEMYL